LGQADVPFIVMAQRIAKVRLVRAIGTGTVFRQMARHMTGRSDSQSRSSMDPAPPRWLAILGIGEDGVEGLSPAACRILCEAVLVVGGARHLALAARMIRGATMAWPSPLTDAFPKILECRGQPVVVLASGDPFCFGIGTTLRSVVDREETLCLPAPSAFSLACARLGWALQDVATISFCGRPLAAMLPLLQPNARILALSADATTPALVTDLLCRNGFGHSVMHVMEALGGPRERLRRLRAEDGLPGDLDALNLLGIEVIGEPGARIVSLARGLPDALFEHDGQITKAEVRAVTLSSLAPRAGELLWDVGCGSGSVGIEWSLCHPRNRAIGIEPRPDRASRAERNALALGVPSLRVVNGEAPEVLQSLPQPDAVFVGGGARQPGMVEACWTALPGGGRIVANAVTVETEMRLFEAQKTYGGTLLRLGVERLDGIGRLRGFRPAMTVTQWAATKP
jgi:precorrin-6Y C5,15-methyltransferase (decarboxylating)